MKKLLIAAFLLLAACATDDKPVGKITVSNETWGHFQEYLSRIASRQGAFAIQKSGYGSYYIWCEDMVCAGGPTYRREALIGCERNGGDCVIFAFGRDILVPYEVEKAATYVPNTTTTATLIPTDTKKTQRISKSLKDEIDGYVSGSQSQTGKYRFLAINPAGDKLGLSLSCKILKSGWGGWTAEGCGDEAKARQLAIDKCGSDCRVIYKGEDLDPAIKIEWY